MKINLAYDLSKETFLRSVVFGGIFCDLHSYDNIIYLCKHDTFDVIGILTSWLYERIK